MLIYNHTNTTNKKILFIPYAHCVVYVQRVQLEVLFLKLFAKMQAQYNDRSGKPAPVSIPSASWMILDQQTVFNSVLINLPLGI